MFGFDKLCICNFEWWILDLDVFCGWVFLILKLIVVELLCLGSILLNKRLGWWERFGFGFLGIVGIFGEVWLFCLDGCGCDDVVVWGWLILFVNDCWLLVGCCVFWVIDVFWILDVFLLELYVDELFFVLVVFLLVLLDDLGSGFWVVVLGCVVVWLNFFFIFFIFVGKLLVVLDEWLLMGFDMVCWVGWRVLWFVGSFDGFDVVLLLLECVESVCWELDEVWVMRFMVCGDLFLGCCVFW